MKCASDTTMVGLTSRRGRVQFKDNNLPQDTTGTKEINIGFRRENMCIPLFIKESYVRRGPYFKYLGVQIKDHLAQDEDWISLKHSGITILTENCWYLFTIAQ